MSAQQYSFGAGSLFGRRTDVSNPTPTQFGVLQNVDLDIEFTNKRLIGQNQFPVAIARGEGKVTGKAQFAEIHAQAFNDLFFGQTLVTGAGQGLALAEAHPVPATPGPYTVTVTNTTGVYDLGVKYADGSGALQRVASGPTVGQYSVVEATGVYTFAAADQAKALLFNYRYTLATGVNSMAINNQLMGTGPQFSLVFGESFQSNVLNITLPAVMSSKLMLPFKNTDFTIMEFDFEAFADPTGNVLTATMTAL